MNKTTAKEKGIDAGRDAARFCEVSRHDQINACCECESPKQICVDCLWQAAFEAEANARQYSPFEFFAQACNESGDRAEGLWEAYDEGVAIGIRQASKRRLAPSRCADCGYITRRDAEGRCENCGDRAAGNNRRMSGYMSLLAVILT